MGQVFDELEILAQEEIDFSLPLEMTKRIHDYHNASLAEIFEFLEERVEVHSSLAAQLPCQLQWSGRKEIEFYVRLFYSRLMQVIQFICCSPVELTYCSILVGSNL